MSLRDTKEKVTEKAGKLLLSYRGHEVYRSFDKCFNYSKDGIIWTQRAGFEKEHAKRQIDDFEDNTTTSGQIEYFAFERPLNAYQTGKEAI